MPPAPGPAADSAVDSYVEAFESARAEGPADLAAFLPPRGDPQFLSVLAELVRVELEYARRDGQLRPLEAFRSRFPELFADRARLGEVAFEEYRLRKLAGEAVAPEEYRRRFGVDVGGWPAGSDTTAIHRDEPPDDFPPVGGRFLDFELLAELGRGAFGRVYLARQGALADRPVALKVSRDAARESQTLARLQHTNVMPIHSVHHAPPFHAVCMPYFPSVTLARLLQRIAKSDTVPDSALALMSTIRDSVHGPDALAAAAEADSLPVWAPFRGRSGVEAVVWIGVRLADGLAHAHARGIVHRDLKPANVLLTEDGQPLILDFNLADDPHRPAGERAFLGGTLPYMAPEQLRAFLERRPHSDPRGDVYALGLILFELLARRHPFPARSGDWESAVRPMIADRAGPPPRLRPHNPAVNAGVEAIVRKCLDPDPARRYPDARPLHEDLQRQFEHRPLRHAREPLRERAAKFFRRHPGLLSTTRVGIAAALLLAAVTASAVLTRQRLNRFEALAELERFRDDARPVFLTAHRPEYGLANYAATAHEITALLDRYGAAADPQWHAAARVRRLPAEQRNELRTEVGELLFVLSRNQARQAREEPDAAKKVTLFREALERNYRAEHDYPAGGAPRALWHQRADLCRQAAEALLAGESVWGALWRRPGVIREVIAYVQEARREERDGRQVPLRTARDHVLEALAGADDPLPLLEEAERRLGSDPDLWFLLGSAYHTAGRPDRAIVCLNTSLALRRDQAWAYAVRGEVRIDLGEIKDALHDFDRALELKLGRDEVQVSRAHARERAGDYAGAEADLTDLIDRRADFLELLRRRANVRRLRGDAAGAKRDRDAVLAARPVTPRDWLARALTQPDPNKRLTDINEALRIDPGHPLLLRNKAETLSELLRRPEEAIAVLSEVIEKHTRDAEAWGGRAVLRARLGRRAEALADARRSLELGRRPLLVYQAAGTFALAGERREALALLKEALRRDPGLLTLVPNDPDLDPLRKDPDFTALIDAAKRLFE